MCRETEEDLGYLDLKENLGLPFEDQRVPQALRDQRALQDSKAMAILVCLALEDYQDPLDQWAYVEWETLEQRALSYKTNVFWNEETVKVDDEFTGEPGVRGLPGPTGPRGIGAPGPKVSESSALCSVRGSVDEDLFSHIRVILGRKVCLAFLAPLATDYKVLNVLGPPGAAAVAALVLGNPENMVGSPTLGTTVASCHCSAVPAVAQLGLHQRGAPAPSGASVLFSTTSDY
ncbi:hypothetical protein CB1_000613006 [Camelus ferus]|nr:hypothetical protein CB1_000613006 [Camelus ferus]